MGSFLGPRYILDTYMHHLGHRKYREASCDHRGFSMLHEALYVNAEYILQLILRKSSFCSEL